MAAPFTDRKGHGESRALAFSAALCADGPAVQLDQVSHDRETEPESAVGPRECETPTLAKAVEDVGQEIGRDALPGIPHRDRRSLLLISPHLDRNPSAPWRELDCIGEEIPHHLLFRGASSSVRNKAAENTRSPRAQRAHHPAAMPKPPRSPRLARVGR